MPTPIVGILSVFFISLVSCKRLGLASFNPKPILAFYYWHINTGGKYGSQVEQEQDALHHFETKEMFVKVMDVDWDDVYGAYPTTSYPFNRLARPLGSITDSLTLTPVIFVTNRALEKTDSLDIAMLAQKILLKTEQLVKEKEYDDSSKIVSLDSVFHYKEIQIDCDWTATTRAKYFALLKAMKELKPLILLTCTLRLHQFKYPSKTGIPPVDELYLMCYNTGDVKNLNENNSIFDYAKAKPYFENVQPYPKKLNFALPAFSWAIIFKNDQFYKIDNSIDESIFTDKAITRKQDKNNLYQMQIDTVINDKFLRKGDLIKVENISEEAMLQAANLCSKAVNSNDFKVVFYDISHINKSNYEMVHKAFSDFSF